MQELHGRTRYDYAAGFVKIKPVTNFVLEVVHGINRIDSFLKSLARWNIEQLFDKCYPVEL